MRCGTTLMALAAAGIAGADDWPCWQGPTRDARWTETGIVKQLPAGELKAAWRVPCFGGYAGPAVAKGRVYVHDFDAKGKVFNKASFESPDADGEERLLCLDAATGKQLWKHAYACKYTVSYACGPRCTPTVDAGRVYTLGTQGRLCCVDAESGQLLWEKELTKEYAAQVQTWGFSGHPLVVGDLLICTVGGTGSAVVAFDKATGAERWKAIDLAKPGYCGPILAEIAGRPTLLAHLANGVHALEPKTGKVLWHQPGGSSYEMSIAAPIVRDGLMLATAYDQHGVLAQLEAGGPRETWNAKADKSRWLYPVNVPLALDGDVLYGADTGGQFRACAWPSGKRLWESMAPTVPKGNNRKNGTVFFAKNDDRWYMLSETGDFLIAKLSAEKYEEISRAPLLKPTGDSWGRKLLWAAPAFANQGVFARNDEEIVFASLKAN